MLVVADASPLVALINMEEIDVLPILFEHVVIPPEVAAELRSPGRPRAVGEFMSHRPDWLTERAPVGTEPIPGLHPGEAAAISLARELGADLLLIDESRGRRAARERRLAFTGTVGVLELAAERGLLDLPQAFARLKGTDFWISHELLDQRLAHFRSKRRPS